LKGRMLLKHHLGNLILWFFHPRIGFTLLHSVTLLQTTWLVVIWLQL
jgi:hypothetical protein